MGFTLSLMNGRGIDGWSEFATGIKTHRENHLFGARRIGLERIFIHDFGLDGTGGPTTADSRQIFARQRKLYPPAAGVLVLFFVLAARHLRSWDAQLMGLVPIFALVVTSRYYWAYLALLPLMGGKRGPPGALGWLTAGQLLIFAAFYVYKAYSRDPATSYGLLNVLLLGYFVVVLAKRSRGIFRARHDSG